MVYEAYFDETKSRHAVSPVRWYWGWLGVALFAFAFALHGPARAQSMKRG